MSPYNYIHFVVRIRRHSLSHDHDHSNINSCKACICGIYNIGVHSFGDLKQFHKIQITQVQNDANSCSWYAVYSHRQPQIHPWVVPAILNFQAKPLSILQCVESIVWQVVMCSTPHKRRQNVTIYYLQNTTLQNFIRRDTNNVAIIPAMSADEKAM